MLFIEKYFDRQMALNAPKVFTFLKAKMTLLVASNYRQLSDKHACYIDDSYA
jgi:hypothetical protein